MAIEQKLPSHPVHLRIVECRGSPYDIGHAHGKQAADLVAGSIAFYTNLFEPNTGHDWIAIKQIAASFHATIQARWPRLAEEMRGLASGAGVSILDIVALNVRTEIAFGLKRSPSTDGCSTAYYTRDVNQSGQAWQGQNWDWQKEQKYNLICLVINQNANDANLPDIKMISEAGIIGKIGINSFGVGVCFNALAVPGCDLDGLPAHLALRIALEAKKLASS